MVHVDHDAEHDGDVEPADGVAAGVVLLRVGLRVGELVHLERQPVQVAGDEDDDDEDQDQRGLLAAAAEHHVAVVAHLLTLPAVDAEMKRVGGKM